VTATLAEAIRRVLEDSGLTAQEVAERIGIPRQTLQSYTYDPHNPSDASRRLPASLIVPLTLLTGNTAILDALEARVGRIAIQVPEDGRSHFDLVISTAKVCREFGEFLSVYSKALADGEVTPRERAEIDREAYEAMQAIAALVGGGQK
jgi:transcriptional regulator with XRE-family HTH domain